MAKQQKHSALKVIFLLGTVFLVGALLFLYIWFLPARDPRREEGIAITANALFAFYNDNPDAGNQRFLDKTLAVSGTVLKTGSNQHGQTNIELKTAVPDGTIFCTLKSPSELQIGKPITLKGICKGYRNQKLFADVVLIDCYPVITRP